MLGKLSVALLLAASPALATDPAPAPEYKIKKVCRTVEVAGSSIPRRSCENRKILVKKPDTPIQEAAKVEAAPSDTSGAREE